MSLEIITTLNSIPPAADRAGLPRPLRVAHLVLSLDLGGLERLVVDLVDEGRRLGQDPSVVCLERRGTLAPQIEAIGTQVVCVDKSPGVRLGTVKRLHRVFQEIRPDVIHTHQIGALFYAGPAARRAGVPAVVHTEHGKHFACRGRTRWLGRLAGRYADRFCCVSRDIADEVRRARVVPARKIEVVVNGIDTARFTTHATTHHSPLTDLRRELGIPAEAVVVGTVGRLNEIKRQDLLIRGFARLASKRPNLHLLLVGDGPLRGELEQLAASLVPADRVRFAGYQPHPERYLQLMDVFALTSRSEGMPLAILEAWAAVLPVVASHVGGVPELVEDGATGLLFTSGDEDSLVVALERVLNDRDLRHRLSSDGYKRVEAEFSLARMAARYERHYRELLTLKKPNVTS